MAVNIRVIAATQRDLKADAENHLFRSDLYYRLSMFTIKLPPLRDRREDLPLLAAHFIKQFAYKHRKPVLKMDDTFLEVLKQHASKGNIRELKNVLERIVILSNNDTLTTDQLPFEFFRDDNQHRDSLDLAVNEGQFIRKALFQTSGNKMEAARLLGIGLSTLYRKITEYHIDGY